MRRAVGGRRPFFSKRLRRKAMTEQGCKPFVASKLPLPATNASGYRWITMSCCTSSGGTQDHPRSTVRPAAPTPDYPAQEQWN